MSEVPHIHKPKVFSFPPPQKKLLPNELPLRIVKAGTDPVVRLDMVFEGGRYHQQKKLQALFTNSLLREGSSLHTSEEIAATLDHFGAWLECSVSTFHSHLTLYVLKKFFSHSLEVLLPLVESPTFPEEEFRTVVQNNLQNFRVNSTKVSVASRRGLLKMLYGQSHPLGNQPEESDFTALTREDLQAFHAAVYRYSGCRVYISGDVDEEVESVISATLGQKSLLSGPSISTKEHVPSPSAEKCWHLSFPDSVQSCVKVGCLSIPPGQEDYYPLQVVITLLGGYFGSRLMSNIREEKGYTYGIYASLQPGKEQSLLEITAETTPHCVEPLLKEVYKELHRLHEEKVSAEELELVRNYLLGEFCRMYESPFSQVDAQIYTEAMGLSHTHFAKYLIAIEQITPEQVQHLACKYLDASQLKEVIAGHISPQTV